MFPLCTANFCSRLLSLKGSKETPQSLKKIGRNTSTLDKGWASNPDYVLSNIHKLTEVEVMQLLEKMVTLPHKRLEKILMAQKEEDPVFISNLIERLPQFLTATLVKITNVCGGHYGSIRRSKIWDHLEFEFMKRSTRLNDQQLVDILFSFSRLEKGSKEFYDEMELIIIKSETEFRENELFKFLNSFSQAKQGSPELYKYLSEKLMIHKNSLSITRMAEICAEFSIAPNAKLAGSGFNDFIEKEIRKRISLGQLHFSEGAKICDSLFINGIGSAEFQVQLEEYLANRVENEKIPELLSLAHALYNPKYQIKHSKLHQELCTVLTLSMEELSIRQLGFLFWSVTRDQKLYKMIKSGDSYSKMLIKALLNTIFRKCVSFNSRGIKNIINSLQDAFPDLEIIDELNAEFTKEEMYDKLEKVILTKLHDFTNQDILTILESFFKVGAGSEALYEKILSRLIDRRRELKPREFIKLFEVLPQVGPIYESTMNEELWEDYLESVRKPIMKKTLNITEILSVFKTYVSVNYMKGGSEIFYMMLNQIRNGINQVPAEKFTETMTYLVEAHVMDIAEKFVPILKQVRDSNQLLDIFRTDDDRIRLLWALFVLDKTEKLVSVENIKEMVNGVQLQELDAFHLKIFLQVLQLTLFNEGYSNVIDYNDYYEQLNNLDDGYKEYILTNDLASKTKNDIRLKAKSKLEEIIENPTPEGQKKDPNITYEIYNNFIDDFLNCIDVVAFKLDAKKDLLQKIAIVINNQGKYLAYSLEDDDDPKLKMSEYIKIKIMGEIYQWDVINVDDDKLDLIDSSLKGIL
ncbi:unnamed protein product [Moneuplotes crassus]|uniref:Uncharacterized protein n=1 Tax=Euplotes crassus TaxID=5936 RepID=A0AAD2D9E7_EUPCR|nr:unnamed protein product [Moneuplotes crassus]